MEDMAAMAERNCSLGNSRNAHTGSPMETDPLPLLGVNRSLLGNKWVDRLAPADVNTALAIAQKNGLPEIIGRILAARGIGAEEAQSYLNPSLKNLMPPPESLQDMAAGARRIAQAIEKREPVAIFGDYDVDGAASSALLYRFLAAHGLKPRIYIPDRHLEGYGPNPAAITQLCQDGARLIVTVDCGITSYEALEAAAPFPTDIVVIDHHQANEKLPKAAAVINPNRLDDLSGQGHLAAAGVVFLVLVAVTAKLRESGYYGDGPPQPHLLGWLDLVALATVCDIVPLKGLNRAYVNKGLAVMRLRQNPGLRALFDQAGIDQAPTPYHLGFILGPRINAGGRLGDSGLGARLLATDDLETAAAIAAQLEQLNRQRQAMESQMLELAIAQAEQQLAASPTPPPILVASSDDFHKGLVGLLASRLTERFARPSLVIAWETPPNGPAPAAGKDRQGSGSLRSIAGVDIGAAVREAMARGLLEKGGGHAMAAGLTVKERHFDALQNFLQEHLQASVQAATAQPCLKIDGGLSARGATLTLLEQIERAGPYGAGNPAPRFVFPAHRISFAKVVGNGHIRLSLESGDNSSVNAIAFRAADTPLGQALLESAGQPFHVVGKLKQNHWQGRTSVDLIVEDAALANPSRATRA